MSPRGILVDVTRCIGCGECYAACQKANHQPAHEPGGFDEQSFTYLAKAGKDIHVRRLCMHCLRPTCVSVCPVGALRKTAAGPVTYDPKRCMGCRYCLLACPFRVPTYEWHSVRPRMRKCQMCATRKNGPACAEACPTGATVTGEREALIREARRRIAAEPQRYFDHIYGLRAAGGTSVLYIGPKTPAELGLAADMPAAALPELTWQALRHVPDVVLFGSVLLGGLYWITNRRNEVREREREHEHEDGHEHEHEHEHEQTRKGEDGHEVKGGE